MNILTPESLAAIGLFLGVLARIAIPYLIKMWSGEIKDFQIYYLWQALAGLGLSAIVVLFLAPNMLVDPTASAFQLIVANFTVALGSTELISELFTLRDLRKPEPTPPAPA